MPSARATFATLGLAFVLATCRDGTAPQLQFAPLAVAPIFPSAAALAAFGLEIDRVRFIVVRPATTPDTLADTTVALPPDSATLDLDLRVPLASASETFQVSVVALAGTISLFTGTMPVEVRANVASPVATDIPVLTYIGPGVGVDSIVLSPRAPFIYFGDSLRLQVEAFQAGTPVPQFYVSWRTSDSGLARISGSGVLRPRASRASVRVIARTPAGVGDSVTATFQPLATQLVRIAGIGQTDTIGHVLAVPIEVEARAADGLGVGGVAVRFRALTGGGAIADTMVITDASGRARTTVTLGSVLGSQTFQATAAGLTGSPVTFDAIALAGAAAQLLAAAGDAQLAIVNNAVGIAPGVLVRDGAGNPVAGVPVTFTVTGGGGGVTGGSPTTGSNGVATVGAWTLGTIAGTNTLRATAGGLSRTFTATGIAAAATDLVATAGNLQSAIVGNPIATKPAVRAQDQFGNPVAGRSVTFALSGGGSITGATQLTNAAGIATLGSWTLDTLAGANALTATAGSLSATFSATGLADVANVLVKTVGDGQTGVVNAALPIAPTVKLTDRYGNAVAGDTIDFFVLSDGGSVANPSVVTGPTGEASAGAWTLANFVAQNLLRVSPRSGLVPTVDFIATGTHDVAFQLLRESVDTQTALAGQPVGISPAVSVRDQFFNPVPGAQVTFALTGPLQGIIAPSVVTTDSSGVAHLTSWTLATLPGLNTLDATVTGLLNSPIAFSANGITTTASDIALSGGNGQTGVVGQVLSPYSVFVSTLAGSPVQGVQVHWAVGGGGSITPASSVTDVNGIASATRTLGGPAGTQTATATVAGLSGSPVTFTATALADIPAQVVKLSVDPQSATVATAVAAPPSVRVVDQFGNRIAGVSVTFAAVSGGGSVTGATTTTDAQGIATVGSWTLGTTAGINNNSFTATVSGLQPASFTATGLAGAPARLAFVVEPTRAIAGDTIEPPVRVAFKDQFGNTNPLVTDIVSLRLGNSPAQGAKLLGTVDVAAVNGVAVFPLLAIDSAGIGYTLLATTPKLPSPEESQSFDIGGVIAAVTSDRLDPIAAAFDRSTGLVFVPGQLNALGVFDPGKGQILQIPTPQSQLFGVAVNTATSLVYITTQSAVLIVDSRNPTSVLGTLDLPRPGKGVAVDEATDRIFVAIDGDPGRGIPPNLLVIDGKDRQILAAIPFSGEAQAGIGVAFNPIDGLVYIAIPNLGVGVFDVAKQQHVGTIPIISEKGAAGTYGVAVDERANVVYATNRSDSSFSIIDPLGLKEVDRVRVGDVPEGLGVDTDRGVLYVANSGSGTISFIATDPKSGRFTVFASLVVGPTPKAAAVDPTTGRLYVPTLTDSRVRVVQP